MMKRRRTRQLSSDERRLWAHVAREIKPLKGKTLPPEPEEETATAPPPQVLAEPPSPLPPLPTQKKPSLPPLVPVERKMLVALRRGRKDVDSVIDLHGMRQEEAHFALISFLHRAQNSDCSVVLVITGKGGVSSSPFDERGVLRRMVPHWLRLAELRAVVVGFEEASAQHGGSGALYVRLRRRRGAG